jgi:hypothetical protein
LRGRREIVSLLTLGLALSSCSQAPTLTDRYRDLDSDRKIIYLAYYPLLTSEQRETLLDPESESPKELIERWKIKANYSFEDLFRDPRHHMIRSLEITEAPPGEFHATAHYADDRDVDVTDDVTWKTTPPQVSMKGNILHSSCLSDTAVVSATFLDEQQGSIRVPIHKVLDHLELRIDDAYLASDNGYNFKLELIAHCQDGSRADVSCQSDWSASSLAGDISGCGNFSISNRERFVQDALKVTAQYGEMAVTRILPVPQR